MNAAYNFCEFQSALKRVAHAVSTDPDPNRDILHCVRVSANKWHTKVTAADGFRLAVAKLGPSEDGESFDIVLNPTTVKDILARKVGKKEDPELVFSIREGTRSLIKAAVGDYDLGSATYQGDGWTYPDTNQIIPTKSKTSFSVYPLPLMQALKTARVFTREGSNAVQLHVSDSLVVVGKSEETGESVSVVSTYRREGPELLIAFNADFLIDFLKVAGTDLVKFEFNKATMPALITTKDDLLGVIMPMNYRDGVSFRRADDIPAPSADPTGESYVWPGAPYTPDSQWLYDRLEGKHAPIDYTGDTYVNRPGQWKITDDIFSSTPEPGAVEYDLTGATFSMDVHKPNFGKEIRTPVITLELSNPRPVPAEVMYKSMLIKEPPIWNERPTDPAPEAAPEPGNTFPIVVYDPNFYPVPDPVPAEVEDSEDPDEEPLPTQALNRLFGALVEIAASVPDHPEVMTPDPEPAPQVVEFVYPSRFLIDQDD